MFPLAVFAITTHLSVNEDAHLVPTARLFRVYNVADLTALRDGHGRKRWHILALYIVSYSIIPTVSAGVWSTVTTLREAIVNSIPDLYVARARMEEDAGYEADVGVKVKVGKGDKD
ncbi:hypothetical protein BDQ17DRAFT_1417092 [Cyathus striatus]|nr:hypothetical protein BDQ17DRAFT_1417092 [Cyathus striatus]